MVKSKKNQVPKGQEFDLGDDVQARIFIEPVAMDPKSVWEGREKFQEETNESREVWNAMDDVTKEAAVELLRRAMARYYDRMPEMLPESFEHKAGNALFIRFLVLTTDIDDEAERSHELTQFELDRMTEGFGDLLDLVRSEVDPAVLKALDTLERANLLDHDQVRDLIVAAAPNEQG